ncbi:hypothetical protein [uncultured Thiodictyon sp.]|uniref:hypothetical protein n=1 Tax=uncultured Thiodictyon sp. TaxID=1846217 RepID=UPI0025D60A89|nr:hypothetical protein [uncultured Thiodictyon sp.]
MEALRKVYDDAPDEILLPIPSEWRHRRIEVVLSALDRPDDTGLANPVPPYRVLKVDRRIVANRDALHER